MVDLDMAPRRNTPATGARKTAPMDCRRGAIPGKDTAPLRTRRARRRAGVSRKRGLSKSAVVREALQRPGAPASARLLAMCGRQHEGWLAWHSVATLAFLIERQQSAISPRDFIRSLLSWAQVARTGTADALAALDLPTSDFNDALQVAAAMACGAQVIVTRNERDFKASPVAALNPEAFLRKYDPARTRLF